MIRSARATAWGWLAALALSGPSVAADGDGGSSRTFRYLMGTSIRVEVYGGTAAGRASATEDAFRALGEVDRSMSRYRDDSELTALNRRAAAGPVPVSAPLYAVLEAAARVSRASAGAFDVTVGPLVRAWTLSDPVERSRPAREGASIREREGYRHVVLDAPSRSVRFDRAGVEIDLDGIARGFAVELAAAALSRRGLDGVIDAGGNLYVVGRPPGKAVWTVGIADPRAPGRLLGAVDVTGGTVATVASRPLVVGRGGREPRPRAAAPMLDPRTLEPAAAALSVTVVSPDGTLGDALSHAVFTLGAHDGLALLATFPDAAGVVATERADGTVAFAMSPSLRPAFHPAPSSP